MEAYDYIEQFLTLAKGTKGKACESLIQQITSHQRIFNFGEFLQLETIQELEKTDSKKSLELLKLFAYGNYNTYKKNTSLYPELSPLQIKKLKILSILDVCSQHKLANYDDLKEETGITTTKELEEQIIEMIYLEILKGKLNQKEQYFKVLSTNARDFHPSELQDIKRKLQNIIGKVETTSDLLNQKIDEMNQNKTKVLQQIQVRNEERAKAEAQGEKSKKYDQAQGGH